MSEREAPSQVTTRRGRLMRGQVLVRPWGSRIRQSIAAGSLGAWPGLYVWIFGVRSAFVFLVIAVVTLGAVWRFARARVALDSTGMLRVSGFWRDREFDARRVEVSAGEALTLVSFMPAVCLAVSVAGRDFVFPTISSMSDDQVARWIASIEAAIESLDGAPR